MTSAVRYKFVNNLTAAPYTYSTFPTQYDGDDKPLKIVRRVLGPQDIGTAAGQSRNALGLILDVIPMQYNVLFVQGITYRPSAQIVGNVRAYTIYDNQFIAGHQANIEYAVNSDNSIRVIDIGDDAGIYVAVGDVVIATIYLGNPQNPLDVMNY